VWYSAAYRWELGKELYYKEQYLVKLHFKTSIEHLIPIKEIIQDILEYSRGTLRGETA